MSELTCVVKSANVLRRPIEALLRPVARRESGGGGGGGHGAATTVVHGEAGRLLVKLCGGRRARMGRRSRPAWADDFADGSGLDRGGGEGGSYTSELVEHWDFW